MNFPDIALTQELAVYEAAYWHEVDHNWGRNAHNFYSEETLFELGGKPLTSRQAIKDFYLWRENRGERTARHVVTNFNAHYLESDELAHFECICLLYAADGVPVLPSMPAIAILDVVNLFHRDPAGGWVLRSRILKAVFRSTEPTTLPP